ncbi:MAG TPA: prepilin-type N-terminal cleavage/methylation domain-containing protein [Candidatus Nanoperiomorbaceae bacterium]|nr:prepilin-type N-terminal cleavage/methylation domain-containing protein [Candidatus Nanoperiomorbaceae bacterium]HMU11704.1 prepilin-type N-terminal cleavage/methylation domain-containing protein [Candidatus Nanoperiomorbaceae bacterium]
MKYMKSLMAKSEARYGLERGDTLVEVMLAIAVLGVAVVGTMTIMNKSTLQMMDTLERTAVRTSINSQAELLNYVRDSAKDSSSAVWTAIKARAVTSTATISDACKYNSSTSFYLSRSDTSLDAVTLTAINSNASAKNTTGKAVVGTGIWIDAVRSTGGTSTIPYIDFYIRACWTRLANSADSRSATIVRLYDPN